MQSYTLPPAKYPEKLLLDTDIYKYHYVSQGKIEIPGVDDAEESKLTDVRIFITSEIEQPQIPSEHLWSVLLNEDNHLPVEETDSR